MWHCVAGFFSSIVFATTFHISISMPPLRLHCMLTKRKLPRLKTETPNPRGWGTHGFTGSRILPLSQQDPHPSVDWSLTELLIVSPGFLSAVTGNNAGPLPYSSMWLGAGFDLLGKLEQHQFTDNLEPSTSPAQMHKNGWSPAEPAAPDTPQQSSFVVTTSKSKSQCWRQLWLPREQAQ